MKIYKESNFKNPLYVATLDNGVEILVFDGYAEGSDGKIYKPVINEIDDDEIEMMGWRIEKMTECRNAFLHSSEACAIRK